ncbi:LOW QUALITY PROTEIN: GRAS transcription factor [Parasponia andersonii]|uniref:GRAS transcription factor n=1 Tax=Parasponia andersonii TaxID=3476 RepID=A0A2P5BET2_PARAD|nr:LOW QUALITY PROTEIN: GRAS transcription factor [Parasponia andersonii]
MKAMPLPFEEFQGKGVLDFFSFSSTASDSLLSPQQQRPRKWNTLISKENCYVGSEPTSVLDTRRSPSPPRSTSTLSSSLGSCGCGGGGGGGGNGGGTGSTDTTTITGVAAAAASETPSGAGAALEEETCGLGMEDWESVLSESPGQEQSIMRLIMADVDDPSLGLNKLLQTGSVSQEMEFNAGGFGSVDQGFGFQPNGGNLVGSFIDPSGKGTTCSDSPFNSATPNAHNNNTRHGSAFNPINPMFSASANSLLPVSLSPLAVESMDAKPQVFNLQVVLNQNQANLAQNPALVMPLTYAQLQEHHVISQLPAKRLNTSAVGPNYQVQKVQFPSSGQEVFIRGQEQQLQLLHQRPTMAGSKQKMMSPGAGDELANHQLQQALIDQLSKAAELIETGNPVLAQGILARLNHHVSPLGKPFQRAAFYFKEALELLLHNSLALPPFNLIFKIGAYKTFSEISPVLQFANFTCNQAILEAMEGFSRIHVIDFDIGYGGQWASFMQELALRNGGAGSLKITAFASPSTHDEFELGFTQENLKHFAAELNLAFELEIVSVELLNSGSWPLPLHISEGEAIAVHLPIGSFSSYPLSLPLVLRFVKQLSPKVVVSLERGCDRTDVPFPLQIIHAFHSYSGLLESLDAVNVNLDVLQKIEKFLLQPGIEKTVLSRHRSPDRTPPWRSSFLNSGFSPLTFSNFTESQAECLVQRTPVRGFHVEKKQSSLALCWQRKELISASAWRC